MPLDDLDPDDNDEQKEKEDIFVYFPNPRNPESGGYVDEEAAQRHHDAVEELEARLGPDIRVFLGEAARAGVEWDNNENPEPLLEFANTLLRGGDYKMELVEVEEND